MAPKQPCAAVRGRGDGAGPLGGHIGHTTQHRVLAHTEGGHVGRMTHATAQPEVACVLARSAVGGEGSRHPLRGEVLVHLPLLNRTDVIGRGVGQLGPHLRGKERTERRRERERREGEIVVSR